MKRSFCRTVAAGLACLPLILPPSALAVSQRPIQGEQPVTRANSRQAAVLDVALHDHGQLSGRLMLADGTAMAGVPVSVSYRGLAIARTATDTQGRFGLVGLRGGVYQINTPTATRTVRLWAPQTAPPAAQQAVTLVAQPQQTVRGQSPGGGPGIITKSLVIGGVVATAVAVPLATHSQTSKSERDTE